MTIFDNELTLAPDSSVRVLELWAEVEVGTVEVLEEGRMRPNERGLMVVDGGSQ